MGTLAPSQPTPLDVVPVETVEETLAEAIRELTALEAARGAAEADADAAESRAPDGASDGEWDSWTNAQLERFAEALRAQHTADMQVLLASAEAQATACVSDARAQAHLIEIGAVSPEEPEADDPADAPSAVPEIEVPEVAPPEVAVVTAGADGPARLARLAPSSPWSRPTEAESPEPPPQPGVDAVAEAARAAPDDEFWIDDPPRGIQRLLGRIPAFVALQALAVGLVLVVVLLLVS